MLASKLCRQMQYISDLHLEQRNSIPVIPKCGEYLALLGDIGNPFSKSYSTFIHHVSQSYKQVFVLAGNHEYWQKDIPMHHVNAQIHSVANKHPNVHFLNNTVYHLDEYAIIGSTLWSKSTPYVNKINVSNISYNFKNDSYQNDIRNIYNKNVKWLNDAITHNSNKKIIVLTHYLPSYKLIVEKYQNPIDQLFFDRFASHLDHLIKHPVKYWLCGHSHYVHTTTINDVKCGINAVGKDAQLECTTVHLI